MHSPLSRRSFLRAAAGGAAGLGAMALIRDSCAREKEGLDMRQIPPEQIESRITFHGELFPDNPNRLFERNGFPPPPEPERDVDVVIIGGGAGGLTAAYRLRDRNTLLLEALPELGGNSMYGEWEGMPFSLGGQYIGVPGTWADSVWDLCGELGLKPLKDDSPLVVVFPGDVQVENPYSLLGFLRMPLPWRVKRDILRFYFMDMPRIDAEARKEELDQIPFTEFMKKYSAEFKQWYELLAKPYPHTKDASAYYAISSAKEGDYAEDKGVCSFPGGLGLISRTLAEKVDEAGPGRMLTGAFAYKVRHNSDGRVLVTYWRSGQVSTVRAKAAIVNAESNIAKEIVEGLPVELKDAMGQMRRFSYPTFHYCARKPIYQRGYRVGVMNCTVQAVTVPDWFCRERGKDRPNILSCFNKMALEDVDLVKNKDEMVKMAANVLSELNVRFTGVAEKVEAIHVFVRSRNYCVPYPGYITRVFPKLGKPFRNVYFANAEYLNPVTHYPDAVTAGNGAADAARKLL